MIEAVNHSVRGMSATAETRSAHQNPTPFLAEPSQSHEPAASAYSACFGGPRPYPPIDALATQAATVSTTLAATTAHPEM